MAIEICNIVARNESGQIGDRLVNESTSDYDVAESLNSDENVFSKEKENVFYKAKRNFHKIFTSVNFPIFSKAINNIMEKGKTMSESDEKRFLIANIIKLLSTFHEGTPVHRMFYETFKDIYIRDAFVMLTPEQQNTYRQQQKTKTIEIEGEKVELPPIEALNISQLRNIFKKLVQRTKGVQGFMYGLKNAYKSEFMMPENKAKMDASGSFLAFYGSTLRFADKQQARKIVYMEGNEKSGDNRINGFNKIFESLYKAFEGFDIVSKDNSVFNVNNVEKNSILADAVNSVLLGKKTLRFITKDGKAYKITPDDNVVPSIKEFIGKNKDNISELRFYDNKDAYTINKEGLMIHYWEEVVDKNNIPLESIIKENHVDLKKRKQASNTNLRINGDKNIDNFITVMMELQNTSKKFSESMQSDMKKTYDYAIKMLERLKKIKGINAKTLEFIESTLEKEIAKEINQNSGVRNTYAPNDYAFGNYITRMIVLANAEDIPETIRNRAIDAINTFTGIQNATEDLSKAKLVMQAKVKHFKEISGLMDRNMLNTNENIWQNMVTSTVKDVYRNYMALDLMRGILNVYEQAANDKNIKVDLEHAQIVDTELVELFKTSIGYPDYLTEGRKIHQALTSISHKLIPNKLKPNPAKIEQLTRAVNMYVSSSLLWQPITAVRNLFQNTMKVMRYGADQVKEAQHMLKDPKFKDAIEKAAKKWGIISEIDYMVDIIRGMAANRDDIDAINSAKALARAYYNELEKNDGKDLKRKHYHEILDRLLITQSVEGWNKDHFKNFNISALSKWAFNTKYGLPSMVETEAKARMLSFVIGVNAAKRLGQWNKIKYDSPFDDPNCAKTGISVMHTVDFMLSQQSLPKIMHGVKGNFYTKMKSWYVRRLNYDMEVISDAYEAVNVDYYNNLKGEKSNHKFLSVSKMITAMFQKDIRKTIPEIAHLRRFALIAGTITLAQEFLLYMPFTGQFYSTVKNMPSFMLMSGGASPLLEAGLFLTTRVPLAIFDDDEELDDDELMGFLKFLPIGVVPMAMINAFFGIAGNFIDIDKDDKDHWEENYFRQSVSPFVFGSTGGKILDYGVKELGWKDED